MKRSRNVVVDASSEESEDCSASDYQHQQRSKMSRSDEFSDSVQASYPLTRPYNRRAPKCSSRNALNARENRIRKKLYLNSLENKTSILEKENKKLTEVIDNQSSLIDKLQKEVKYLKSVISNSPEIGGLIRNIHHSTGMLVSTSLDKSLSLKTCISKPSVPIARKTAHPWEELDRNSGVVPVDNNEMYPSPPYDVDLCDGLSNLDALLEDPTDHMFGLLEEKNDIYDINSDHNYHESVSSRSSPEDDVGVCLHVSNHRVSLEFCSTCSENACQGWMTQDQLS